MEYLLLIYNTTKPSIPSAAPSSWRRMPRSGGLCVNAAYRTVSRGLCSHDVFFFDCVSKRAVLVRLYRGSAVAHASVRCHETDMRGVY